MKKEDITFICLVVGFFVFAVANHYFDLLPPVTAPVLSVVAMAVYLVTQKV
jgi:hypothetical protein